MALPPNEVQIRNYIASITAGKFLQDYTKLNAENRAMSIAIARNKGYIAASSEDLSKIPPFMFYQVVDEAINATKNISEIYDSYNKKTSNRQKNSTLFNDEIRNPQYQAQYGYVITPRAAPGAAPVTVPGAAPVTVPGPYEELKTQLITPEKISQYIALLNDIYKAVEKNPLFTR